MKKSALFLCVLVSISLRSYSQDPLFTNTQQSLVYLNPSFAGSNGFLRTQSVFSSQFPFNSSPRVTFYNAADAYIKPIKGGIAVSSLYDNQWNGLITSLTSAVTYARHFSLFENKLKIIPSLQVAILQKQLDRTKLTFADRIDYSQNSIGVPYGPYEGSAQQRRTNVDLNSGLLINYNNVYVGASVFHITQPNEGLLGDTKLPCRLSLYGAFSGRLNHWTVMHVAARFEKQGDFDYENLTLNCNIRRCALTVGYGSNKVINLSAGYKGRFFALGLGYNFQVAPIYFPWNFFEAQFSVNIRDKVRRKSNTYFESY